MKYGRSRQAQYLLSICYSISPLTIFHLQILGFFFGFVGIAYTQSVCFAFLYILQISKFYPNGGLSGFCLDFGETNFICKIFLVKCFRVFGMIRNFFQLNHQRYKNFEYVSSKICLIFSHFTPPFYIYFSFVTPSPPFFFLFSIQILILFVYLLLIQLLLIKV